MTGRQKRTTASACILIPFFFVFALSMIGPAAREGAPSDLANMLRPAQSMTPGLPAVTTFDSVWRRPLFTADRRPVPHVVQALPKPAPAPLPPPPVSPATDLLAVAIGPGQGVAIVRLLDGKSHVLVTGDRVNGWILEQVKGDYIILRTGAHFVKLAFPKRGAPALIGNTARTTDQSVPFSLSRR